MPRRLIAVTTLAVGMCVVLPGCTGGPAKTAASPAPAGSFMGVPASPVRYPERPVTMADARHCPVTTGHPVPSTTPWRDSLFGWSSAYGNGLLWVGSLWPRGVVIITPDNAGPDGRLGMKFGWYLTASGFLAITGRRLDAPAPALSAEISQGDAPSSGFRASGVIFPTEGCWQVTGSAGRASLTFVTFVIRGHCDLNAIPIRCVADRAR
jgi:hypothetical protein